MAEESTQVQEQTEEEKALQASFEVARKLAESQTEAEVLKGQVEHLKQTVRELRMENSSLKLELNATKSVEQVVSGSRSKAKGKAKSKAKANK